MLVPVLVLVTLARGGQMPGLSNEISRLRVSLCKVSTIQHVAEVKCCNCTMVMEPIDSSWNLFGEYIYLYLSIKM